MSELVLPEGWNSHSLEIFLSFALGGDWGKPADYDDPEFETVYCIRGTEISHWAKTNGSTAVERKIKATSLEKRKLQEGDILVEISGGGPDQPVGRTVVIEQKVLNKFKTENIVCTNFLRMFRPTKFINPKFLNFYLQMFYYSGYINEYQSGSNNLRNLKFKEFLTIDVPFAPIDEQNAIVSELEKYFEIVFQIQARLDAIPKLLEKFRQSVMRDAVSGELVNYKSELNKVDTISLEEVVISSMNGLSKRSGDAGEEEIVLRLADFKDAKRVYGGERKIRLTPKELEKYRINNEDILIVRVNGSVDLAGKFILYKEEGYPEAFCDHFIKLTLDSDRVRPEFLVLIANEGEGRYYLKNSLSTSAGQNTINQKSVKGLELKLPPLETQDRIIQKVDFLFSFADQIEKNVAIAKARVDHLTQSILHQAFTGQLTAEWRTQNPDLISGDNSAEALLARIEAEKKANKTKKKNKA